MNDVEKSQSSPESAPSHEKSMNALAQKAAELEARLKDLGGIAPETNDRLKALEAQLKASLDEINALTSVWEMDMFNQYEWSSKMIGDHTLKVELDGVEPMTFNKDVEGNWKYQAGPSDPSNYAVVNRMIVNESGNVLAVARAAGDILLDRRNALSAQAKKTDLAQMEIPNGEEESEANL